MLELQNNSNKYSTQPNEKLNGFSTIYYHICTNKNNTGLKYLSQLFKKRNRLEFYYLDGKIEDLNDSSDNEDDDSDYVPESDETDDESDKETESNEESDQMSS